MKIKSRKRKKCKFNFFLYVSILFGITAVSTGYCTWNDTLNVAGEIRTTGLNVNFTKCSLDNYKISEDNKSLKLFIYNAKVNSEYVFTAEIVNNSLIPVECDKENEVYNKNNNFKILEVLDLSSFNDKSYLTQELSDYLLVRYKKPDGNIEGSLNNFINFKINIGDKVKDGKYSFAQNFVFKQNQNSKWQDQLNLGIEISVDEDKNTNIKQEEPIINNIKNETVKDVPEVKENIIADNKLEIKTVAKEFTKQDREENYVYSQILKRSDVNLFNSNKDKFKAFTGNDEDENGED